MPVWNGRYPRKRREQSLQELSEGSVHRCGHYGYHLRARYFLTGHHHPGQRHQSDTESACSFDNYFHYIRASWLSPIIAIALAFGVLAGVLTWVAGPSKGIFAVGKAGYMPPFFQKTNKLGVQKNILYVQGGAVTVLSLLFVVMPSVQSFYQILSQLTVVSILSCIC